MWTERHQRGVFVNKRGHIIFRLVVFIVGLLVMSLGLVFMIRSDLGATPWDTMHVGLYYKFGLTVGTWSILVGLIVLVLSAFFMKEWPRFGAYLNMLLVGLFMDMYLSFPFIVTPHSFLGKLCMFLSGVVINGYGMGIYISAQIGAGPRDSFMLAVTSKTGWKVSRVRRGMEIFVLIFGWLLGGPVHIGTILYSLLMGTVAGITLPQCQKLTDYLINKMKKEKNAMNRGAKYENFH
jgi:uncharacterized membrane protein YczE